MSGEGPSLAEDPEQDSFRPLIGQLADESSCLIPDHRESAMVRLVGHPSAHSSMIGQLPCPASVSLDQGGWDSTLSRMIGRLSHQPSSHWLSGGQDFYAGEVMGRMALQHSSTWLDDGLGESPMRPLVGELDDQHSGSSGKRLLDKRWSNFVLRVEQPVVILLVFKVKLLMDKWKLFVSF